MILLEMIVKAPDQREHMILWGTTRIGECVQPVHQSLRMHFTEHVPVNGELTSVITDNQYLAQHPKCLDAAPQRPLR